MDKTSNEYSELVQQIQTKTDEEIKAICDEHTQKIKNLSDKITDELKAAILGFISGMPGAEDVTVVYHYDRVCIKIIENSFINVYATKNIWERRVCKLHVHPGWDDKNGLLQKLYHELNSETVLRKCVTEIMDKALTGHTFHKEIIRECNSELAQREDIESEKKYLEHHMQCQDEYINKIKENNAVYVRIAIFNTDKEPDVKTQLVYRGKRCAILPSIRSLYWRAKMSVPTGDIVHSNLYTARWVKTENVRDTNKNYIFRNAD